MTVTLFEGTGFQTEGNAFFLGSLFHETVLRKQEEPGWWEEMNRCWKRAALLFITWRGLLRYGCLIEKFVGDKQIFLPKTKTTSLLFIASSAHMHLFPFAINENLSFLLLTSKPETRLQLIVIAAIINNPYGHDYNAIYSVCWGERSIGADNGNQLLWDARNIHSIALSHTLDFRQSPRVVILEFSPFERTDIGPVVAPPRLASHLLLVSPV